MSAPAVVFDEVSKFYGEVLGVNRVTLQHPAGNHQPGRAERLGQDHADEPDDGAHSPRSRLDHACAAFRPAIPST